MRRGDRRALLAAVANELEDESCGGALDAEDLHSICWRAVVRASGGRADGEGEAAAAELRAELAEVYVGPLGIGTVLRHGYDVDGLRKAVAGLRGQRAYW